MRKRIDLPFGLNPEFFIYYGKKILLVLSIIIGILCLLYGFKETVEYVCDFFHSYKTAQVEVKKEVEPVKVQQVQQVKESQAEKDAAYIKKRYKIGDRIKFYDQDRLVVCGSTFRMSICGIGVIERIEKNHIYGSWGDYPILINANWEKVTSNREWSDLVKMEINGYFK